MRRASILHENPRCFEVNADILSRHRVTPHIDLRAIVRRENICSKTVIILYLGLAAGSPVNPSAEYNGPSGNTDIPLMTFQISRHSRRSSGHEI
jgi:hypothetical protein